MTGWSRPAPQGSKEPTFKTGPVCPIALGPIALEIELPGQEEAESEACTAAAQFDSDWRISLWHISPAFNSTQTFLVKVKATQGAKQVHSDPTADYAGTVRTVAG